MHTNRILLGGLIAMSIAFGSSADGGQAAGQNTASATAAAPAASVDHGKQLFVANGCWTCHNYNGSGGRQGPRLSQTKLTSAAFIAQLRKPRQMPPYSAKVMSDQDVTDVWNYIKTFPPPPPVDSIPLLNLD